MKWTSNTINQKVFTHMRTERQVLNVTLKRELGFVRHAMKGDDGKSWPGGKIEETQAEGGQRKKYKLTAQ